MALAKSKKRKTPIKRHVTKKYLKKKRGKKGKRKSRTIKGGKNPQKETKQNNGYLVYPDEDKARNIWRELGRSINPRKGAKRAPSSRPAPAQKEKLVV